MFFVKAPEGTAKIILSPGGKFSKVIMNWKNYFIAGETTETEAGKLIQEGDIIKKDGTVEKKVKKMSNRPLFGAYFFKVPVWQSVYSYSFEWSNNHYRGKKKDKNESEYEKEEKEKETLNYINLQEQYFRSRIVKTTGVPQHREMEDKEKEASSNRLDVEIKYMVTLRVINPYEFCFDSPENSYDAVLERLDNVMGDIISQAEFNLVERLQGSRDALWYGLRNPKNIDYGEEYPNLPEESLEKLMKKHKEIWENYERDITRSESVRTIFKGLRDQKLIQETFPEWGIEIIPEGVEIITVEPPAEIKESRKELAKKDIEFELKQRDREMAEVDANINKIRGEGVRKADYAEMRAIDDLAKLFKKYDEPNPLKSAIMVKKAYLAAQKGQLKEINIKGLEGGSIASIAAQLGIGKELRSLFGNNTDNDSKSNNEAGFKPEKKEKEEAKKEEKKTKITLLDKEGKPFYSSTK